MSALEHERTVEADDATELFTRHSPGIYRYCLRRLGSPEEAEDALQLTYLNAWRSLKSGFEPAQRGPWLFGIAANVCSSALRTKLGGTSLELRDPGTLDELAAHEKAGREELLGLSEALRTLPVRQRRALLLRDWQGLSYREIAAELAVSVASVETLLFRGRKRVAATLATADWKKVAPSVRALLIWPFAFMRTKSLPVGGGEHLKVGIALAGGSVAPLIAFGVLQGFLPGEQKEAQAVRHGSVAGVMSAQAAGSWLDEGPLPHASLAIARREKAPAHPVHRPADHESTDGADPRKPTEGSSGPEAPSAAASPAPKITVCHSTSSAKTPGVTVTVSEDALKGLQGDSPGPCG
jgi:RNA polymerase sigma-70 factor (ECF subfamily)